MSASHRHQEKSFDNCTLVLGSGRARQEITGGERGTAEAVPHEYRATGAPMACSLKRAPLTFTPALSQREREKPERPERVA